MAAFPVIIFSEPSDTMTFAEGLTFIERTRRQLDRFDVALPHDEGKTIDLEEAAAIRRLCDNVEADIHRLLGTD
jgi:hypothetical protein